VLEFSYTAFPESIALPWGHRALPGCFALFKPDVLPPLRFLPAGQYSVY